MSMKKKQILAMKAAPYSLINGFLYKMGIDDILRRCVLEHERDNIMYEAHYGPTGVEDDLPDACLFQIEAIPAELEEIAQSLQYLNLKSDYRI